MGIILMLNWYFTNQSDYLKLLLKKKIKQQQFGVTDYFVQPIDGQKAA